MAVGFSGNDIAQRMSENPPPTDVFEKNYTACANPRQDSDEEDTEQVSFSRTLYGIQWSLAALFSYFGKSVWTETLGVQTRIQSNCVGAMLGGDVGLDFLSQIITTTLGADEVLEDMEGKQIVQLEDTVSLC